LDPSRICDECGFHDIALLELIEPVDDSVTIIPLAPRNCVSCEVPSSEYVVSGFGDLYFDSDLQPDALQYAFLVHAVCPMNDVPDEEPGHVFSPNTLCALYNISFGISDSCQGDSGGPLVQIVNGTLLHQVGIVSGGSVRCGVCVFPVVFLITCRRDVLFQTALQATRVFRLNEHGSTLL
jgi:hypothetical protein